MLTAALLLLTVPAVSAAAPVDDFTRSLAIAGHYHRAVAGLPIEHAAQPETAWYEMQRLTDEARSAQHAVHIQPCFARWWAYEFMGLELTTLSHELRRAEGDYRAEADMVERLGAHMWAQAERVLPVAAAACGSDPTGSRPVSDVR